MAKRMFDLACSLVILVLLSPLLAIVALLVKLTSPGPVLFRQERIGRDGVPFFMLKFRSMVRDDGDNDDALREAVELELAGERVPEGGSFKLANDARITKVGRVIRATSIDELPQLFNVVGGSMSLVGPRPALPWEVEMFPEPFRRRDAVLPGITGLWQVSGRSTLGTLEMLELDLEYVDTQSFGSDLRILLMTVPTLLRGDGAR